MEENKAGKLKKLIDNDKIRRAIIICGIVGIALIFLSSYLSFDTSSKTNEEEEFAVTTYSTEIESDLQSVISKIQGAGETHVLLTMENSVEYVYLEDSTTKTKEIQPLIRGVLVVCEGGDDPVVVERITQAVTKALDISTAKVCITKLSE
jgi:stage III sporulation protein AG